MFPANDLWGNSSPVCPYCKEKQSIEEWRISDESVQAKECDSCGKRYDVVIRVEYMFDTVGSCEANKDLPHNLVCNFESDKTKKYGCVKCSREYYDWQLDGGKYQRITKDKYAIIRDKEESPI